MGGDGQTALCCRQSGAHGGIQAHAGTVAQSGACQAAVYVAPGEPPRGGCSLPYEFPRGRVMELVAAYVVPGA